MRIVIIMPFLVNICYATGGEKPIDMNSIEHTQQIVEKTLDTFRPFVVTVNDANSRTTLNKCELYAETMMQIVKYSKDDTLPDEIHKRCQCVTSTFSRLWTAKLLPRLQASKDKERVTVLSDKLSCFQRKS